MGAIEIRLPKTLHNTVRELAKRDSITMTQFIVMAVTEKIANMAKEEALLRRSDQEERAKLKAARDNAPENPPPEE